MNQTDTPLTDAVVRAPHDGETLATYASRQGSEFEALARRLERALAKANADKAVLVEALEKIMRAVKTPPLTNMSRADMREIAGAALAQVVKP